MVGNDSALIFIAEDLRAQRRILELESRVAELEARLAAETPAASPSARRPRPWKASACSSSTATSPGARSWPQCSPRSAACRCAAWPRSRRRRCWPKAGASEQPFGLAVVALLGPGGASGLGQRAALRSLGLQAPVVMSSDVDVRGHEQHGIAAVIRRPYGEQAVREALMSALRRDATSAAP